MKASDRQYERVARWLDGESVELTADERALAEEVRRDEQTLARRLPAEAPSPALHRVQRRLHAAMAARPRRWTWIGAGAAVAAGLVALVLAMGVFGDGQHGRSGPETSELEPAQIGTRVPSAEELDAAERDIAVLETVVADDEYDLMSEEIAAAADMAWAEEADAIEQQMNALEDGTNGFDNGRTNES